MSLLRFGGKDPQGNAKGISVDDEGQVRLTSNGSSKSETIFDGNEDQASITVNKTPINARTATIVVNRDFESGGELRIRLQRKGYLGLVSFTTVTIYDSDFEKIDGDKITQQGVYHVDIKEMNYIRFQLENAGGNIICEYIESDLNLNELLSNKLTAPSYADFSFEGDVKEYTIVNGVEGRTDIDIKRNQVVTIINTSQYETITLDKRGEVDNFQNIDLLPGESFTYQHDNKSAFYKSFRLECPFGIATAKVIFNGKSDNFNIKRNPKVLFKTPSPGYQTGDYVSGRFRVSYEGGNILVIDTIAEGSSTEDKSEVHALPTGITSSNVSRVFYTGDGTIFAIVNTGDGSNLEYELLRKAKTDSEFSKALVNGTADVLRLKNPLWQQGIAQEFSSGTILICEWAGGDSENRILRSTDDGATWTTVLTLQSEDSQAPNYKQGFAHFHNVAKAGENLWIASTGDQADYCSFWLSVDDGLSWDEIAIGPQYRSLSITADHTGTIYWATEGVGSGIYKADINKETKTLENEELLLPTKDWFYGLSRIGSKLIAYESVRRTSTNSASASMIVSEDLGKNWEVFISHTILNENKVQADGFGFTNITSEDARGFIYFDFTNGRAGTSARVRCKFKLL